MNTTTLNTTHAPLELGTALQLWLDITAKVLRLATRAAWNGLYAITKARLLGELGEQHPARRL